MAIDHRVPAILAGLFSSIAVLTAAVSGASCNFLILWNESSDNVDNIFGSETDSEGSIVATFGILCEHAVFPREGDKMWELSRIFLILSLTLGSLTAGLAWAVASFLTPTNRNWTGISVLAAVTAVLQVPIFILLEAEPCLGDGDNQGTCKLGPGSYALIVSDLFYIAVTVLTQCYDRPRWGLELDLWKVHRRGVSRQNEKLQNSKNRNRNNHNHKYNFSNNNPNEHDAVHLTSLRARSIISSSDDDEDAFLRHSRVLPAGMAEQEDETSNIGGASPSKTTRNDRKDGFVARLLALFGSSSVPATLEVPAGETHSVSDDNDYDYESQLLHDLEIVRVMPPKPLGKESSEGQEVSIETFDKMLLEQEKNIQSFEAVVEEQDNENWNKHELLGDNRHDTTSNPWTATVLEQHQMIDSPSASLLSLENSMVHHDDETGAGTKVPMFSNVQNILDDLRCEEMISTNQCKPATFEASYLREEKKTPEGDMDSGAVLTPASASSQGVRGTITKRPASKQPNPKPTAKRSFRKKLSIFATKKDGYAQMSSDQSSDDADFDPNNLGEDGVAEDSYFNYYNETDVRPPSGLQLMVNEEVSHLGSAVDDDNTGAAAPSTVIPGLPEDQIKNIYSALDRGNNDDDDDDDDIGGVEENSILDSKASNHKGAPTEAPFDCISIGSTHSDPGPLSFEGGSYFADSTDFTTLFTSDDGDLEESEHSTSFTDLFRERHENDDLWNHVFGAPEESSVSVSTFDSDGESSGSSSQEPFARGRPASRSENRRKRRPVSPVESIQSRSSLLHTTIDEETEEDVKNELDSNTGAASSVGGYSLKRTLSAPERRLMGPIKVRRERSAAELRMKLEKLKRSMQMASDTYHDAPAAATSARPLDLPPRSPIYVRTTTDSPTGHDTDAERSVGPMDEANADNSSAVLSELLGPDPDESTDYETAEEFFQTPESKGSHHDRDLSETPPILPRKNLWEEEENASPPEGSSAPMRTTAPFPNHLETTADESWKDLVSPLKDRVTPTKPGTPPNPQHSNKSLVRHPNEHQKQQHKAATPVTDVSDETSETGRTRSTISYDDSDDDDSFEIGPSTRIRSKSLGRPRNRVFPNYRASNSLSPTRKTKKEDAGSASGCLPSNLSSLARESRIRRLQQKRKGYLPLDNYYDRSLSPEPTLRNGKKDLYGETEEDPELTPKRKTITLDALNPAPENSEIDRVASTDGGSSTSSAIPNDIFQPSLLDPEQECPEFDNILDHLDLQLIDLNRPIGAEYGDDEGSM